MKDITQALLPPESDNESTSDQFPVAIQILRPLSQEIERTYLATIALIVKVKTYNQRIQNYEESRGRVPSESRCFIGSRRFYNCVVISAASVIFPALLFPILICNKPCTSYISKSSNNTFTVANKTILLFSDSNCSSYGHFPEYSNVTDTDMNCALRFAGIFLGSLTLVAIGATFFFCYLKKRQSYDKGYFNDRLFDAIKGDGLPNNIAGSIN